MDENDNLPKSPNGLLFPKVGEMYEQVKNNHGLSIHTHVRLGEVLKVVKTDIPMGTVTFDRCFCGTNGDRGCTWKWSVYGDVFLPYYPPKPITEEEAAQARSLPDVVDVASFFGVKT